MKKIKITGQLTVSEFFSRKEIEVTEEEYKRLRRLQLRDRLEGREEVDSIIQGIVEGNILDILDNTDPDMEFKIDDYIEFCDNVDDCGNEP